MKTLKKITIAVLFAIIGHTLKAQTGYGEIRGIIKDKETLEAVPFATVKILQGNVFIGGTQTDEEGNYNYKPLNPGKYELMIIDVAHKTQPVNKINVIPNEATYVDVKLEANTLTTVEVIAKPIEYAPAGVDRTMYSFSTLDATEIKQLSSSNPGDIKGMLSSISSNVVETGNGEIHVRGARDGATGYYVDGVRCLSAGAIPGGAIENLTFFTGGVPAMYGDMTSGAVIITTKSYFSGIREKNIRRQENWEKQQAKIAKAKALEDEAKRIKEIEEEKQREQMTN